MPFNYIGNLQGRIFRDYHTYRFPKWKHPHHDLFEDHLKRVLCDFVGKIILSTDFDALLIGDIHDVDYWAKKEKQDTLAILGITEDHLILVDWLLDEFRKDIPNFLRDDLFEENDSDEIASALYQNAVKASLEYHLLAPFLFPEALEQLRGSEIILDEHLAK